MRRSRIAHLRATTREKVAHHSKPLILRLSGMPVFCLCLICEKFLSVWHQCIVSSLKEATLSATDAKTCLLFFLLKLKPRLEKKNTTPSTQTCHVCPPFKMLIFLETTAAERTCRMSQGSNMWPFADKRVYLTTDPACSAIIKSSEADRRTHKQQRKKKEYRVEGSQAGQVRRQ